MSFHEHSKKAGNGPRLRSVLEASRELGVSRSLLYELISSGALHSVKVRRRRFIPREAIDEFVAKLSREGRS